MSLDALMRDQARTAVESAGQPVFGYVSRDVASLDDPMYVIVPPLQHEQGPCVWTPRGDTLPQRGMPVLVVLDTNRRPWVVTWDGPTGDASSVPVGGAASAVLQKTSATNYDTSWGLVGASNRSRTPQCLLYRSAALSLTSGTMTTITWDGEEDDSDNMHAASAATIVVPLAGLYHVFAEVCIDNSVGGSGAGRFIVEILVNGADNLRKGIRVETAVPAVAAFPVGLPSGLMRLAASDTLSVDVYQGLGLTRSVLVPADSSGAKFGCAWVSP